MLTVEQKPPIKRDVSSLWRTATLCMLAGMAMHWWVAIERPAPVDDGLSIRGDSLPPESDYAPRLGQMLDAVDLDRVPFPDALNAIAKQAGITLVITQSILNSAGALDPSPQPKVTLHMKHVSAGDAFNSVYVFLHDQAGEHIDVRLDWSEANGITYTTSKRFEPRRFYTRIYDVKKLLDHWDQIAPVTTQQSRFNGNPYYDGRASWLEAIIDNQPSCSSSVFPMFRTIPVRGESRGTFLNNGLFLITATASEHRRIEQILRELDGQQTQHGDRP